MKMMKFTLLQLIMKILISTSTKKNISFKLSDPTQKAKTQKLVEINSSTQVKPVIKSISNFKQV